MSDGNLIPISDEQAKLGQELVKAVAGVGRYFAGILDDLPKDFLGGLIGDKVKAWRTRRLLKFGDDVQRILLEQGVQNPEPPSLKFALPILVAAADENSEELQVLWVRLLAAAMNPARSQHVRLGFGEALQKLDPLDARVLDWFDKHTSLNNQGRDKLPGALNVTADAVEVSLVNLVKCGFVSSNQSVVTLYGLTPFGREFLRSVSKN